MRSPYLRAGFGALLALFALPCAARAQGGTVTGTVVESGSARPLPAVTVTLRSPSDSARATTDASGRFRLQNVRAGSYTVQAALLGYDTYRRAGVAVGAGSTDLGTLQLSAATLLLEELRVETQASTAVVAADRTIYSTSEMPVAAGGMATDVLRSVPELEVDVNGGVQLRGTVAQIHINGRPAPMQGQSLELFLQQFPADRIERIEVIPNPSARFEAEGAGGIVNIVLKDNVDLGLSGNLFANAGSRGEAGAGGRMTYQRGRMTVFGGAFARRSDRRTDSYDLRQNLITTPVTLLEQDGWNDREGLSGNLDLTTEWKLSDRSTVRGNVGMWTNGSDADGLTVYTEMAADRTPTLRYDRGNVSGNDNLNATFGASATHRLGDPDKDDHELSLDVEYQSGDNDSFSRVRRRSLDLAGDVSALPVELTLDDFDQTEREVEVNANYVRPWGEGGRFELGYRGEMQDTDESRALDIYSDEDETVATVSTLTGFGYREVFHSAYATASRQMGRLSAQVGLRAEQADTRLELTGLTDTYENSYFSLFPSANVRYDLGQGRELRLAYSRRVRRPQVWVLNPINRSNDPLNRNVGNPDIDPQYTHALSLDASWTATFGTLRFSPYYRRTVDDWAQIKTVDAQGVSTVTWENLASTESYGTSLTASVRPIGGVSGNLSVSGSREVRNASNLAQNYSGENMRYSARANVSARVTETLALQAMGNYTPRYEVAQGTISSSLMTHVGIRQQLMNDRVTLNLMVTDPFDLYRSEFTTRDPTHIQIGRSRWSARAATLSVAYSFGRPPRDRRGGNAEEEQQEEQVIR
jgi:Outer membrane protein beta-barrel family/Carboxypeptidase regulatory-like domain/TonB-dependent Receptor Plug Domain